MCQVFETKMHLDQCKPRFQPRAFPAVITSTQSARDENSDPWSVEVEILVGPGLLSYCRWCFFRQRSFCCWSEFRPSYCCRVLNLKVAHSIFFRTGSCYHLERSRGGEAERRSGATTDTPSHESMSASVKAPVYTSMVHRKLQHHTAWQGSEKSAWAPM